MTRDRATQMALRASCKTGRTMFISEWHGDWVVSNYHLKSGVLVIPITAPGVDICDTERKDIEQFKFWGE